MSFKKFGVSDDQKVELDNEAEELRRTAGQKWTERDREELKKENEK